MCPRITKFFTLINALILAASLNLMAASTAYEGYTLVGSGSSVKLYDPDGSSVKSWSLDGSVQTAAYLLEDGGVLAPIRSGRAGAHDWSQIVKLNWDGEVVWQYTFSGNYDIEPMPNGNVVAIQHTGSGMSGTPGRLVEIEPSGTSGGTIVWECDVTSLTGINSGYMNSVSYNPALGQFAVTIQDPALTVAVINYDDGSLASTYKITTARLHGCCWSMNTFIGSNTVMADCDENAMNLGNITFIGNGLRSAVEINPTTSQEVNRFSFSSFNSHQGGTQRLPNGNTLVVDPSSGIVEVDENGTEVWSLNAISQRCYKYGLDYPGLDILLGESGIESVASKNISNSVFSMSQKTDKLILNLNGIENSNIKIFKINGEELLTTNTNKNQISIDTKDFASGMYLLKVTNAKGAATKSIQIFN